MLDLDVAGYATVTARRDRDRARARGRDASSRSPEDYERLYSLVGWDEKFAAHNAAMWKHGLLVRRPEGRRAREAAVRAHRDVDGGPLFWRLRRRRRGGRARLADRGVRVAGRRTPPRYSNAVVELFVEQGAKLEYVSLQNLSRETWHFASHHARVERDAELDWVAGGFGSKKGKIRIQNDLAGRGATSRVTGAYFADGDAAPRLRHVPGAHRARHRRPTSPSRARCATARRRSGAG